MVSLIAGTIGGALGALLQERLLNYNDSYTIQNGLSVEQLRTLIYCVGGLTGMFLGVVDGILRGNSRTVAWGAVLGALGGIVLGYVGISLGNTVYALLGGSNDLHASPGLFAFSRQVIARSFGWALMGLGLGVGSALATRSPRRILHGALGGFLGGFAGGFVFDLLAMSAQPVQAALGADGGVRDVAAPSRLIGFTAIGGLTGFFIGLVEELFKQAWVKVLAGRNEGKDFTLDKPMSILGRDERCDVPLYGDPAIGAQHAAIRAENNRHTLIDGGAPLGTIVNGQPVAPRGELLLRDGDMIQIGAQRVLFREKATASKLARPPSDAPRAKAGAPGALPIPAHLCPFCGGAKNAQGGCLCSVGGGAVSSGSNNLGDGGYAGGGMVGGPGGAGYGGAGYGGLTGPGAQNSQVGGLGGAMNGAGLTGYGAFPAPASPAFGAGGTEMPRLVGVEGPYTGQGFLLTSPNIVVGREPDKDISLAADSTISRNHARIVNENGDFVVYDNGSANGTFVNGRSVAMQLLAPGDIVQFGNSKFRYE